MFHRFLHLLGQALARYLSRPHSSNQTGMPTDRTILASSLQPGDVLLVEGNSRISSAIKYLTQSTWSHAALYVGPQLGGRNAQGQALLLVEADILEGVCTRSLEYYQHYPTRICRPVGLSAEDLARLLETVTRQIGMQYDLKNVLDLARYLLPLLPLQGPWRRRMMAAGSGAPTRAICSTLIAGAFQEVGYPLLPAITFASHEDPERHRAVTRSIFHIRNRRLFVPRDFDVSPWFEVVKPTLVPGFDFHRICWEPET